MQSSFVKNELPIFHVEIKTFCNLQLICLIIAIKKTRYKSQYFRKKKLSIVNSDVIFTEKNTYFTDLQQYESLIELAKCHETTRRTVHNPRARG
jgi:hypothetical protein